MRVIQAFSWMNFGLCECLPFSLSISLEFEECVHSCALPFHPHNPHHQSTDTGTSGHLERAHQRGRMVRRATWMARLWTLWRAIWSPVLWHISAWPYTARPILCSPATWHLSGDTTWRQWYAADCIACAGPCADLRARP
jgi:hypothetical protein